MPDHTARITSGSTRRVWTDPATDDAPTRINPLPRHPHTYQSVDDQETELVAKATVDGVEGPMDVDLDSRLFYWFWAEHPSGWVGTLPVISLGAGQSSVATVDLDIATAAERRGHWLLACRRDGGGGVNLPFDIEQAEI